MSRRDRWLRLAACVLAVLAFMFVVGPWLAETPPLRPLTRFIEENDINAGGYFYTDVEEFSDASAHIRR